MITRSSFPSFPYFRGYIFGLFIINITNPTSYLSFEKLSYTERKLTHSVQERKVMHKSIPPVPIPCQGICLRCQSCVSPGGEAFAILSHPRGWEFDIWLPHLQKAAEKRRKRAEKAKVFCRRKQISNWCNNLRCEHYVVLIFYRDRKQRSVRAAKSCKKLLLHAETTEYIS